ncbi:hypothetical protein AArcMg_2774 [Natrarchaeobaculum sulfurireducens]|uniref:Uncharacterized protein n=1 Tax=Natrarchaeobaculum sulfurireducens TaxID=2044521 RepID=A0A346PTB9_9EURY|nr:hypothetical protein AArcMg_2774 [Natrarchaeobaculum sulfurireducens]
METEAVDGRISAQSVGPVDYRYSVEVGADHDLIASVVESDGHVRVRLEDGAGTTAYCTEYRRLSFKRQ